MSLNVVFWINETVYSREKYLKFLQECRKVEGKWSLIEEHSFDAKSCKCCYGLYKDDCRNAHKMYLYGYENDIAWNGELISVWFSMYKERPIEVDFADNENYSVYIDVETILSKPDINLALQFLIPLKAFEFFGDIVVIDENGKAYSNTDEYLGFVKEKLVYELYREDLYQEYFLSWVC
ncbi:MAG: hypothetical protein J0M03_03645 [Acidobacteria bacterium]|nr:hypothetical protein [Acidobacteriota bacterium]